MNNDVYRLGTSYNITTAATSTQAQTIAFGTVAVLLSAQSACWVEVGVNAVASKTASTYLAAGAMLTVVASGGECVAAVEDSAAGTLSVTELTR